MTLAATATAPVDAQRVDVPASDESGSIASASLVLTVATLIASGGNYLLNLLLARWMTPSEFGDANLIVTIMLGLTAVAISLQLITAQSVSTASSDHADTSASWMGLRRNLLRRSWLGGAALAMVLAAASPAIRDVTSSASAVPFVLLALGMPFYLAQSVERGVLQGRLKFLDLAATLVVEAIARLGIAVALVAAGFGVIGATAGITVSFIASWVWGRRSVSSIAPGIGDPSASETLPAGGIDRRRVGQATMILLVGQIFINNGDVVLAKMLFDADQAGVYSVVALIGRAIFFLSWSVVTAAFPLVAKSSDRSEVERVRRQAVRTVAALCAALTVAVAIGAPRLAPLVFGSEYRSAGPLFAPYAIATSLFAIANVRASLAVARGRRLPALIVVGGAAVQTLMLLGFAHSSQRMVWLQVIAMGALCLAMTIGDRLTDSDTPDTHQS